MMKGAKMWITRRPLLAGLLAVAGVGVVGGAVYEHLGQRYAPTPYDDLLGQLDDRNSATRLGAVVLGEQPGFNAGQQAELLRRGLRGRPLHKAIEDDIAAGRLMEVHGWLIPESLGLISGIAAMTGTRPA